MKTFEEYKTALGAQESGNRYNITNRFGYTGRYQFGKARLKDLGYTGTMEAFKNSPALQEQYFLLHVKDHAMHLLPYLLEAKSKYGTWLTLSGLIAYAHLLGAGQARKWVNTGVDKKDGNGVSGKTYATKFSGYEIPGYNESDINESVKNTDEAHGGTKSLNTAGITDALPVILLIGALVSLVYYYYK